MPTLSPRSRKPSARLTAVVDLPTPPLPDATAMIAATPGMPAGDGAATARPAPCRARGRARRRRRLSARPWRGAAAPGALGGERDHHRGHARHARDGGFGALAHALPLLDRRGIDRDREKHLAVGGDDVGKFSGRRQRLAVGARTLPSAARTSSLRAGHAPYIARYRARQRARLIGAPVGP